MEQESLEPKHGFVEDNGKLGQSTVVPVDEGVDFTTCKHKFPWKGGLLDKARAAILRPEFQAAVQLCLGSLLIQLFTYNHRLAFTQACLATVFFVAGMLLVSQDCHIGGRLISSALVVGPVWIGALICCATISLARAPHVAYTTFLIVFLCIALLILTTLRVKGNLGLGIVSNLAFGITLIAGQFAWPARELWHGVCIRVLKIGLLSSFGVFTTSIVVLPTLAGDDLRMTIARSLKELGQVVSDASGHLLLRADDEHIVGKSIGRSKEACDELGAKVRHATLEELEITGETDQANIERLTNPEIMLRPKWMTDKKQSSVSLSQVRQKLQRCRALFQAACLEPKFLRIGIPKLNTHKWSAVMNAIDSLVIRIAALDSLIEADHPLMLDSEFIKSVGTSMLPAYRMLFAQIAAALATAARSIKAEADGRTNRGEMLLTKPIWGVLEYDLAAAMYTGLKSYWGLIKAKRKEGHEFITPPPELRAALYMGTIGTAILEAVVKVEDVLQEALLNNPKPEHDKVFGPVKDAIKLFSGGPNLLKPPPDDLSQVQNILIDEELSHNASARQRQLEGTDQSYQDLPSIPEHFKSFRHSMRYHPLPEHPSLEMGGKEHVNGPDSTSESQDKDGGQEQVVPLNQKFRGLVQENATWIIPLLKVFFAWDVVLIFKELLVKDIPHMFSSWKNFYSTLWFFFASYIILGFLLALQQDKPWVRKWNGLYIDMTVVVVLSEKVDTTFQKGLIRITTTILGAVVGFVVMANTSVASSSYGLAAIVCFLSFIAGAFSLMPSMKYALFLFLITLDSLILCQYDGKRHGSTHTFYTRLIVTVWGVIYVILFDLIMPWYASAAAMEMLGQAVKASGEILCHFLEVLEEELENAALGKDDERKELRTGLRRLEESLIQKRLAGPLAATQASIAREGVLWKQGVLAMPRIVGQIINLVQKVLEKLAAMEVMLAQKPIISGRYSGTPWRALHQPLQPVIQELKQDMTRMCNNCAAVMSEYPNAEDLDRLHQSIDDVMANRVVFRESLRERLRVYVNLVVTDIKNPILEGRSTDDGIRYQSNVFATAKALDKMTKLARTLAADPWVNLRCKHPHSWRTWRTWTGHYGYD